MLGKRSKVGEDFFGQGPSSISSSQGTLWSLPHPQSSTLVIRDIRSVCSCSRPSSSAVWGCDVGCLEANSSICACIRASRVRSSKCGVAGKLTLCGRTLRRADRSYR